MRNSIRARHVQRGVWRAPIGCTSTAAQLAACCFRLTVFYAASSLSRWSSPHFRAAAAVWCVREDLGFGEIIARATTRSAVIYPFIYLIYQLYKRVSMRSSSCLAPRLKPVPKWKSKGRGGGAGELANGGPRPPPFSSRSACGAHGVTRRHGARRLSLGSNEVGSKRSWYRGRKYCKLVNGFQRGGRTSK